MSLDRRMQYVGHGDLRRDTKEFTQAGPGQIQTTPPTNGCNYNWNK